MKIYETFYNNKLPVIHNVVNSFNLGCPELTIMVAANLISMVDRVRRTISPLFASASGIWQFKFCLLQFAIGGPQVAPRYLEDRAAMVQKILSLGYSGNSIRMPHLLGPIKYGTDIDCSQQ